MSTTEPETDPFEILGLGVEATEQEIKSAYRKLSLKVHPDRVRIRILCSRYKKLTQPPRIRTTHKLARRQTACLYHSID